MAKNTKSKKEKNEIIKNLFTAPREDSSGGLSSALVLSVFLSVVFGVLSGFLGFAFILSGSASKFPFLKEFDILNTVPEKQIVLRQQQYITVTESEYAKNISEKAHSNIAVLLENDTDVLSNDDVRFYGYVASSDGWLVFPKQAIEYFSDDAVVLIESTKYKIANYTTEDEVDVVFAKVDATNLNPVSFAEKSDIDLSKDFISVYRSFPTDQIAQSRVYINSIAEKSFYDDDETDKKYIISGMDSGLNKPSLVYLNDKLVGFAYNSQGTVYMSPLYYLPKILKQIFENKSIKVPYLGVRWRLVKNYYFQKDIKNNTEYGAEILKVYEDSPAEKAGLKEGYIILKIDDIPVDTENSLSDLVLSKDYNEGVFVRYMDDKGVEDEVLIKLQR